MNKINFLDSVDWSFPVPISYGPNRINELPDICKTNNLARPLLVTDKSSKDLPFMKKIKLLKTQYKKNLLNKN